MAFPAIGNTNTTNGTTATTTPVVNLPTGIVAGNLLLVLIRVAVAGAIGWPGGWTELFDDASDASDDQTAMAWRKADGTEGATITLSSGNGKFAALSWRITGAEDPTVQPPQFATLAVGTSVNPNPGLLTPTGGAKDYLWLAVGGWEGEQTSPPGTFPANYTLNQIGANSGAAAAITTNCRVAGAGQQLNAASEDPGTYTISVSDDWTATTVAIHPAPTTRRGQVSWSELEVPNAPRRGQVSWSELEAPNAPRRATASWSEFELPDAPRRGQVSWSEMELPNAPRRATASWAELEVPNGPRRGQVSWAELEVPPADRRGTVSWGELEIPAGQRRGQVSFAELEMPLSPRRAFLSWTELEAPEAPRRATASWTELEVPTAPRRAFLSWTELEAPNAPRRATASWAELEVPDAPRRGQVSWSEMELPNAPRRAFLAWTELEVPNAAATRPFPSFQIGVRIGI